MELRAEDEARTRDLNLGKVALYQLSYFRIIGRAKIRNTAFPEKFCCYLLILRGVQCISRNFNLRLAFITVRIQPVTGADKEGDDAKYFQVEKEDGGMHPAIRNVF